MSSRSINIIEGSPSFFKIIRYPSSPHLALPDAFVRNYLEKIPKNPTLKTATGEHSWKLRFIKIGQDYCFAHGWDKLAKDVQLSIRDVVVFWLIDPFTFQVSFLDANGCSKDLPLNNKTNTGDKNSNCDDDDDALCFEKVIGKTHKYNMLLPVRFVKAAGLKSKSSIKVKDHEGKDWSMGIVVEACSKIRYSLTTPWSIFRRSHQLSHGDVCFFKFDKKEGILNLTKVVRNQKPPQNLNGENVTLDKHCDGGVKVKIEYESGGEMKAGNRKRALEKPGVKVKMEDGSGSVETGQETEKLHICKRVVYF